MAWERELDAARKLAAQAGGLALRLREQGLAVHEKADLSLVSEADRACERLIVQGLEEEFPDDGILGEEGAARPSRSGRRWIIDPIDGTLDFLRGIPVWSVLIALEEEGEVVAGVCCLAEMGQTYEAMRGAGAYRNGVRVKASKRRDPAEAVLCVNALHRAAGAAWRDSILGLMARFRAVRSFGGCQDAMLVAAGRVDAWIEPEAHAWDLAALKIIAEEAGAAFFNLDGRASIHSGNCVIAAAGLAGWLRERLTGTEAARPPARDG